MTDEQLEAYERQEREVCFFAVLSLVIRKVLLDSLKGPNLEFLPQA